MDIRDDDLRAVARLWRELADFPAGQFDAALLHCLRELVEDDVWRESLCRHCGLGAPGGQADLGLELRN